jgi:trimeric autotransporter adhesin
MRRIWAIGAIAAAILAGTVCQALAATTPGWECIPTTAGQAVVSGGTGGSPSCGAGTTAVLAPTYVSSGVGGKPTVVFGSVNVQIVSGSGSTDGAVNGEGNLVIGYAENTRSQPQTGSNDLILGTNNGWTGFGELVSGTSNLVKGSYAGILGGQFDSANAPRSAIAGGCANATGSAPVSGRTCTASGGQATVGGNYNLAAGTFATVLGGCENVAGPSTSISASCVQSGTQAVLGGFQNTASGLDATVSGGEVGSASGGAASVAGGQFNVASGNGSSVAGGDENTASGDFASVLGGFFNSQPNRCASIPATPGSC